MKEKVNSLGESIAQFIRFDVTNQYNRFLNQNRRGNVRYEQLDNDTFLVKLDILPYIIEKKGKYYEFGEATLGLQLRTEKEVLIYESPPRILTSNYKHPQVFRSGEISYNITNPMVELGIKFHHQYDFANRKMLARMTARLLIYGQHRLERGYFGDHILPVYNIEDVAPMIADKRQDIESYAVNNGINLERIFNNF